MGRTMRIRRKNRKSPKSPQINPSVLTDLESWMTSRGWSPTCPLTPHIFESTGRGLKCLSQIPTNQIIIKIPKTLLLTTSSIYHSKIRKIFLKHLKYDPQTVLSALLAFERHLDDSTWRNYLNTLPREYTVPAYCKNREKSIFPRFIVQDLEKQTQKIAEGFKSIVESIKELKMAGKDGCDHCGRDLGEIITFREFKWGFFTVNTRAVYIDSSKNVNNYLNIHGEDNLALAPFLDLFNHSYEAQVQVGLEIDDETREFYQIRTLKAFDSGSQVFINYGGHCNAKLYLEYGFFMGGNPLDEVEIDFGVIEGSLRVSRRAREFIEVNGFHRGIGFGSGGLNYQAKIVFFVLGGLGEQQWKERVFRFDFEEEEISRINRIGVEFVEKKRREFLGILKVGREFTGKSESFRVFEGLLEEYVRVCNRCLENLGNGNLRNRNHKN